MSVMSFIEWKVENKKNILVFKKFLSLTEVKCFVLLNIICNKCAHLLKKISLVPIECLICHPDRMIAVYRTIL